MNKANLKINNPFKKQAPQPTRRQQAGKVGKAFAVAVIAQYAVNRVVAGLEALEETAKAAYATRKAQKEAQKATQQEQPAQA
jgi:hypothetical protein